MSVLFVGRRLVKDPVPETNYSSGANSARMHPGGVFRGFLFSTTLPASPISPHPAASALLLRRIGAGQFNAVALLGSKK